MRGCENRAAPGADVNLEVCRLVQPVSLYGAGLSRKGDGLHHDLWSAAFPRARDEADGAAAPLVDGVDLVDVVDATSHFLPFTSHFLKRARVDRSSGVLSTIAFRLLLAAHPWRHLTMSAGMGPLQKHAEGRVPIGF